MDKWQTGELLAFWAIVVAVIAILVGIWAARRWGTRRGKLLIAHSSTGLLAVGAATSHLKVTFKELTVEDPHLVSLLLKNVGPHDITRDQFDGGSPLSINLNSTLFGIVSMQSSDGIKPKVVTGAIGSEDGVVSFQPSLIPKGTEWVVEFIVSGPANPELRGRLVNTDIVEGESTSTAVLRTLAEVTASALPWPLSSITGLAELRRR